MYTKEQVDAMLSQVEQEFEKTLGSIEKNENIEENIEASEEEVVTEEVMAKSEEENTEEEYETVDELYNSMSKSEKEAHYNSIKKSLFGEAEEEVMAKSEEEVVTEESEDEVSLVKSENEELKKSNEELKKSYEELNALVSKMFTTKKAPSQKAITNTNYIAKSEETGEEEADLTKMSKSEITQKLKSVDQENLTKSDRNAINDFYLKNASVETIKHLIIK